mgnify:CR=1 FL=1
MYVAVVPIHSLFMSLLSIAYVEFTCFIAYSLVYYGQCPTSAIVWAVVSNMATGGTVARASDTTVGCVGVWHTGRSLEVHLGALGGSCIFYAILTLSRGWLLVNNK